MMRLRVLAGLLGFAALPSHGADQRCTPQLALKPCRLEHPARMLALPAECGTFRSPRIHDPEGPHDRAVRRAGAGHQPQQGERSAVPDRGRSGHFGGRPVHLVGRAVRPRAPRSRHHPGRSARHRPLASPRLRVRQTRICSSASTRPTSGPTNLKCRDELAKNSDLRHVHDQRRGARSRRGARARSAISASISTAARTARASRSITRGAIRRPRAR